MWNVQRVCPLSRDVAIRWLRWLYAHMVKCLASAWQIIRNTGTAHTAHAPYALSMLVSISRRVPASETVYPVKHDLNCPSKQVCGLLNLEVLEQHRATGNKVGRRLKLEERGPEHIARACPGAACSAATSGRDGAFGPK